MTTQGQIASAFRQAVVYGGTGLIGKAVGFVMLPIYAHYLGDEGYGILGMIDVVVTFIALIIGYGVSGAMTRFFYDVSDHTQRCTVVSTTILLMGLLVVFVTIPALLAHDWLAKLAFGKDGLGHYVFLALITFMANATGQTAENYIVIKQRPILFASLSLARLVVDLSLNVYLVVKLELGVEGWLYASLISAAVYSICIHGYVLRDVGLAFDKRLATKVLAFSLPMLPGYIAMFVRCNADRVMLRTWLGLGSLGVFEMLYKFVALVGLFAVEPFLKSWMVKVFEICDRKDGPRVLARAFTYHLAVIFAFTLLLSLEVPVALKLLTPTEFWVEGTIVFVAILSRGILGAYYHLFFGLLYAKKTSAISLVQILTAILSLAFNWVLVPTHGLLGAVIASFLTVLFQCVIAYFVARPYYRIPVEWGRIGVMFVVMAALFLVGSNVSVSDFGWDSWITGSAAPAIEMVGTAIGLDRIEEGKFLNQLVKGSPLLGDACFLSLFAVMFVGILHALNIVSLRTMVKNIRGG